MRVDLPIHYYNPELTIEWLRGHCLLKSGYTRLLKIDRSIIRKPHSEFVIPLSLFDRDLHDHTGLTRNDPVHWRERYYESLLANISRLDDLQCDVCVEIFIDPELAEFVVSDIQDERVNFHVMAESSVGATGMFWRFMLADIMPGRTCQTAVEMDIDLDWRIFWAMLTNNSPVSLSFYSRGEDALEVCPFTKAEKFTSICAGLFSYRLADVDFNVSEAIARYWYYCNVLLAITEPQNSFNRALNGHSNGFGNTWNFYGNDERFLCKVFYYHLKRKGALNFLTKQEYRSAPLLAELADMQFTREHGSKVIYV